MRNPTINVFVPCSLFGKVAKKTQIPLIAMYVFSLLAGVLAVVLDIDTLVEMMSIGTLSAYLVVSGGVIVFRYRPNTLLKVVVHRRDSPPPYRREDLSAIWLFCAVSTSNPPLVGVHSLYPFLN